MKASDTRTAEINPECAIDSLLDAPQPRTMIVEKADIVISLNGRDEGKRFLVIGTLDEYALLADGKGRKIDKPKRKKHKHLKLEDKAQDLIAAKLIAGEKVTNNEIRRTLAQHTAAREEKGGM